MYTHQIQNLHAPMFAARGLRGLSAGIPISLTIDTPYQTVGKPGKMRIIGAPPAATVFWSSYKNRQSTGEFNASYNQKTEANGTAEFEITWTADQVGTWVKEILIQDPAGNNYTAMVEFRVDEAVPVSTTTPPAATATSGITDFLQQGFYLGSTLIPYWIPIAGIGVWAFLGKRR